MMANSVQSCLYRWRAWLWRFGTLPFALRALSDANQNETAERMLFGQKLYLKLSRSNVQKLIYLEGERFIEERYLLFKLLKRGMTVVDVGANIGYYALLFARSAGHSARILCFEPDPENLAELRRNCSANNLRNATVYEKAVGSFDGTVGLTPGLNSIVANKEAGVLQIPIVKLDTEIQERIDFIKIDVEGYELHVLNGAERIIKEHRPILFVEVHPWLLPEGHTVKELLDLLRKYYNVMEFYERRHDRTVIQKFSSRYFSDRAVIRIDDVLCLLNECEAGTRRTTFWLVCKPANE
jgi:FkbM family methyltransferase